MAEKHIFMPFIHRRSINFPVFCVLRVTHCLKILAWRSFFSNNFPWLCYHMEGTHTQREKQTSIQTYVPSSFFCRRDPVICLSVWKILGYCRDTYWVWTCILDLVGKISIYFQLVVKPCGLATSLKSIQLLFSYLWQYLWSDLWDFWSKQAACNSLLLDHFRWHVNSFGNNTRWHLVLSDTLLQPVSSWTVAIWPRSGFIRLGKCRETSWLWLWKLDPLWKHGILTY